MNENTIRIGDKFFYKNKPVLIITILENSIVEVLGEKKGEPFNFKVPISLLKDEEDKDEIIFF